MSLSAGNRRAAMLLIGLATFGVMLLAKADTARLHRPGADPHLFAARTPPAPAGLLSFSGLNSPTSRSRRPNGVTKALLPA